MQNPALIRPIGLAETDNILRSLDWSDSPTLDFVAEGPCPYLGQRCH